MKEYICVVLSRLVCGDGCSGPGKCLPQGGPSVRASQAGPPSSIPVPPPNTGVFLTPSPARLPHLGYRPSHCHVWPARISPGCAEGLRRVETCGGGYRSHEGWLRSGPEKTGSLTAWKTKVGTGPQWPLNSRVLQGRAQPTLSLQPLARGLTFSSTHCMPGPILSAHVYPSQQPCDVPTVSPFYI